MSVNKYWFQAVMLLLTLNSLGQSSTGQEATKVTSAVADYFKLDRENMHLHLNKNIFISDETIWFKGYIIEKKSAAPYLTTTNVYVQLLDNSCKTVISQLIYAENSTFDGFLKLNKMIPSGKYYIRSFTNYMNNFVEDESAIYPVTIINPQNGHYDTKQINYDTAEVSFFPESGVFLEGITNTIGVMIADCNGNGISVKGAAVRDSKGNEINNFSTNLHGYGKFDIVGTKHEQYTAAIILNQKVVEKALPLPSLTGIALSVNNYALANKTVIKIKTNERTMAAGGIYRLLIQKGDLSSLADIALNGQTESTLSLTNDKFMPGINNLILTNSSNIRIAERVIFNPLTLPDKITLQTTLKTRDSIKIQGISGLKMGEMSISVLPAKTTAGQSGISIYSSLLFDNYLDTHVDDAAYYLLDFNRGKHFELDNMLMTKKSKYQIDAMLSKAPTSKYESESGLIIKGIVNSNLSEKSNYKVQMQAHLLGVNEYSGINDKNEFYFKNVFVTDSTNLHFSLLNKKEHTEQIKLSSQILNNNRTFNKSIAATKFCPAVSIPEAKDNFKFPVMKDVIMLDTISIAGKKKKTEIEKNRRRRNGMEEPKLISEVDVAAHRDILSYIQFHGYNVSYLNGGVQITNQRMNTLKGSLSPQIYMDDAPVTDFSFLQTYNLDGIDEITINKFGFGGGSGSSNGIIRIYTKTPNGANRESNVVVKSLPMMVAKAFQTKAPFANPEYDNVIDSGFHNYGTIHWIPKVPTDLNGAFNFTIPTLSQKAYTIQIEGISSDGQTISQTILYENP